ncbi:hypothetical protein W97_06153 [Coniosporium apollinis CBS 100218]|uniref:Uncharacterized protein n=1 Tax=Coniosporium apollinis (strain CBS 100218) TaxID=1168221 RepID=R7YZF0_CONA1|nr:uncharacterized protein W97_06153 [Coniosporium apollinis CBS 100218]EON67036.1 hypothetical protein W97_06153 [Coniosporium apollinis CBS 100218]
MAPKQPAPRRSTRSTKGKVPERLVSDPTTTFKVAKTKPKGKGKIPGPPRSPINRRARGLEEVRWLELMVVEDFDEEGEWDEEGPWDDEMEEMGGWDGDVAVERKEQVKKEESDDEDEEDYEYEVTKKQPKKARRAKKVEE